MTDTVHVIPRQDFVGHTSDAFCVCGPKLEPVERADGSVGWVYAHHALDGRR